jgi:hypothetical protein
MMPISPKYAIAVILACLAPRLAFCQADTLALSSAVVTPGGTASLNLSLTSPAGSQPAGLQWTLTYAPTAVVNISASVGTAGTAVEKVLSCAGSPGTYTCFLTGLDTGDLNANSIPNGVVAVISATIAPGTTTASIGITNALGATPSGGLDPITATGGTITTLAPVSVTSLSCNPGTLTAGASTTCTVSLNQAASSGTTVALSDNNALLSLPSSVTVPAGASSANFIATAGALPSNQSATVTATLNGTLQTVTLSLIDPAVVSTLSCNPNSINSGGAATCTLTLNEAAPTGGSTIGLSTSNPALTLPASITVPAGATSTTFNATAGSITTNQSATITAVLNGASRTVTLTLNASLLISALSCNSTNLDAGASSSCTLSLAGPAPTGGASVSLSANSPALTVPSSVNVPAGSSTATFAATAITEPPEGESTQTVVVTATLDGASQSESFTLTICPCSLWPATAQPINPASTNTESITVGMKFTSSISGYITGVRFYKGSTNKGTHVGSLWTSSGTQLAQVSFNSETKTGWQTAYFRSPVAITANTTYVIAYYAPQGHNAADNGSFTSPVSNLPLEALTDGQNGPNGVYTYGSNQFPATGASATNYWIDVIFNTSATIGTVPPVSVWAPTAVPTTAGVTSSAAAELGLAFMSDVPGYITGVRFYKSSQNLGTHDGYLWTAAGKQLASVTFTNETASGWQQANFATPIAIEANTPYVVSYWSPKGHYADDAGYFATSGVTNQMLYAPTSGQYGPNGSSATSNVFPSSSSTSSNYWVDLVFTTAIQ